jgi:hypothetical protein
LAVGPGSKLGPYEVTGALGAGGMGEVWRARDPRLGRDVAIKVLPASLAGDPERLARFERECRLLASLNHPHVASVLGLEDAGGVPALVMELVEGPTLADRIAKDGAIGLPEALALSRQVADAVEYAHERGIVHRDLKPGNVKLTPEGAVKVLDFGLAKALALDEASPSSPQITQSPTMSVGTQAGVLLGTAAYMAPEQARGKVVDRRADIWAFGVVLFEMLTGRQMFAGETVSDTIARILERQPDWGGLPARTPARVRELLRRCLEKDPKQRVRDMGDVRLELDAAIASVAAGVVDVPNGAPRASGVRRPVAIALTALAGLAALAGGWALHAAIVSREGEVRRLSIVPPKDLTVRSILFSSDGRTLYASGTRVDAGATGKPALWRRPLDRFEWSVVPGTEGAMGWDESQDGRWLYVLKPVAEGSRLRELQRIPSDGSSPPASVLAWSDEYGSWEVLPDGRIAIADETGRRFAVIAPGSTGAAAWRPIRFPHGMVDFLLRQSLPDGRTVLVSAAYYPAGGWTAFTAALDLGSGELRMLEENAGSPYLLGKDLIVMSRNGTVLAARWDAARRELASRPVAVLSGARTAESWSHANLATSSSGALGYAPGGVVGAKRSLAVVHRDGRIEPWNGELAAFEQTPTASRDGRFAAVTLVPPGSGAYQMVLTERGRPGVRRVASDPRADCRDGRLSPDGRWMVWVFVDSDSTTGLFLTALDGSAPPRKLLAARSLRARERNPEWYPDGRSVLVTSYDLRGRATLRRVTIGADTVTVSDVVRESFDVLRGAISPDGGRIAYLSTESGTARVVVAALRPDGTAGAAVPVSQAEGAHPAWSDASTVIWGTPEKVVMAATVSASLEVSAPGKRFDLAALVAGSADYDLLPDGSLLVVRKAEGEGEIGQLDVVLNYRTELERVLKQALAGGR